MTRALFAMILAGFALPAAAGPMKLENFTWKINGRFVAEVTQDGETLKATGEGLNVDGAGEVTDEGSGLKVSVKAYSDTHLAVAIQRVDDEAAYGAILERDQNYGSNRAQATFRYKPVCDTGILAGRASTLYSDLQQAVDRLGRLKNWRVEQVGRAMAQWAQKNSGRFVHDFLIDVEAGYIDVVPDVCVADRMPEAPAGDEVGADAKGGKKKAAAAADDGLGEEPAPRKKKGADVVVDDSDDGSDMDDATLLDVLQGKKKRVKKKPVKVLPDGSVDPRTVFPDPPVDYARPRKRKAAVQEDAFPPRPKKDVGGKQKRKPKPFYDLFDD